MKRVCFFAIGFISIAVLFSACERTIDWREKVEICTANANWVNGTDAPIVVKTDIYKGGQREVFEIEPGDTIKPAYFLEFYIPKNTTLYEMDNREAIKKARRKVADYHYKLVVVYGDGEEVVYVNNYHSEPKGPQNPSLYQEKTTSNTTVDFCYTFTR